MRQILVDHFRRRFSQKRGGAIFHQPFDEATATLEERGAAVLAVDEALAALLLNDERLGKIVEYKFFGGMNEAEIGAALGLSVRTVSSDWRRAKAWLSRELGVV
jgi:RNA polymerase sigma factor (TIGR02999 family)